MQDWLNAPLERMSNVNDNVYAARNWLLQMGEGAKQNDITIMYCMSLSRHILQSLEIPAVTQARATNDYKPNKDHGMNYEQWRLGITSMFADAVGIAPFKDSFWTTSDQPHNHYKSREPYPALQALVSSLTAGPVGPGDMVNGTDRELLMRCCNDDGLILKASRPAFPVDDQLIQSAFGDFGPHGEVWTTYSDISSHRFGIIFAAELNNSYTLNSTHAFGQDFEPSRIYGWQEPVYGTLPKFSDASPLQLTSACTLGNFCLYYTTPSLTLRNQELLLLGERTKWIPMSPHRITRMQYDDHYFFIFLKGAPGEAVQFDYVWGSESHSLTCEMSEAGTARINITDRRCFHT